MFYSLLRNHLQYTNHISQNIFTPHTINSMSMPISLSQFPSKLLIKYRSITRCCVDPIIRSAPELPAEVKASNQVGSQGSISLICNGQGSPAPNYRLEFFNIFISGLDFPWVVCFANWQSWCPFNVACWSDVFFTIVEMCFLSYF